MDSLRGKLLLAGPVLKDPNFDRTVVLITEHSDEGAMGLVLNRPSGAQVGEAVPDLAWVAGDEAIVFVGGPVAPNGVIALAEWNDPSHAAVLVDEDLGFVQGDAEDTRRRSRRRCAGCGSTPATQAGVPASSRTSSRRRPGSSRRLRREELFSDDPDGLWSAVLRRKGREFALLSTMPPDPSLN